MKSQIIPIQSTELHAKKTQEFSMKQLIIQYQLNSHQEQQINFIENKDHVWGEK